MARRWLQPLEVSPKNVCPFAATACRVAFADNNRQGGDHMGCRSFIAVAALAAALLAPPGAQAFDESKYPDLKGQWRRTNTGNPLRIGLPWDQTKPVGLGQEAPLTQEYQAIYAANLRDQAEGGQGTDPTFTCLSPGMPRVMIAYAPMEVVVTPETTYILMEHIHDNRRIHTDGRPFPTNMDEDPQFSGYSIGKWLDEDGDGRTTPSRSRHAA